MKEKQTVEDTKTGTEHLIYITIYTLDRVMRRKQTQTQAMGDVNNRFTYLYC